MRKPSDAGKHTDGNFGNGLTEFSFEREMMNLNMLTDEELLRHAYALDPLVQSELERELMKRMEALLDGERDVNEELKEEIKDLEFQLKERDERIEHLESEAESLAEDVLRLERELDAVGSA